jgi:hypothetical protein
VLNKKRKARTERMQKHSFIGNCINHSLVIGNHGDAKVVAKGHFNVSGILFMLEGKASIHASGTGQITLSGKCKHLVIVQAEGNCLLDFQELKCDMVTCKSLKGDVTVLIGDAKRINVVQMEGDSTLKVNSHPLITTHSLEENARIICPKHYVPPVVVRAPERELLAVPR